MRKSKIKQITLAMCLAFMPISVFAAGLGKLNVNSGLGEPLNAEIELLSISAEELATLTATIASEDAYAAQGINRAFIHSNIKVELGKSFSGAPVLKIRSSVPVDDPFLDMLVQVDWATGRLQREYTVLLDPPGYQAALEPTAPLQITAPTIAPSTLANSAVGAGNMPLSRTPVQPVSKSVKATPKVADKPVMPGPKAVEDSTTQTELTTVRGDTLSSIASRMQAEGVSLDQMLMALYDNNKNAFIGNNINQLKVGQIIRVPSNEQLTARSAKEASQQVKVHASNWNDYRNSLAGVVATTPVVSAAPEEKQTAAGKIATAEDKATPIKTGPQDVVKLSSGDKEKTTTAKNTNKAFEEKISALQEETTAREKALLEAQERSNALEKQIQDMQKLLALKSQTMANVQKNAENTTESNVNNSSAPTQAGQAASEKTPTDGVVTPPAAASSTVEAAQVADENAVNKDKIAVTPTQKPPVAPQPLNEALQAEPSFVDSLLGSTNPLYIALGLLLAILVGGWLYLRSKRKRDLDSFERGILTSGGLRANTVFGNTTGATGNSDTSFLTDFAQSADGSMIDTNDVDPIAEAEVYMAYGRDAQAEEILKDAITKEPTRYELHLKLLEMYAARQDVSAFEAIAGELYTTLGADDPTWEKVAAIGAVMEPSNPLYGSGGGVANSATATQKLDASDFTSLAAGSDLGLDFSTDKADATDSSENDTDSTSNAIEASFADTNAISQTETFEIGASQPFKPDSLSQFEDSSALDFVATSADDNASAALDVKAESNAMDFDLSDFSFDAPTIGGTDAKTIETIPEKKVEEDNSVDFISESDHFPTFDLPDDALNPVEKAEHLDVLSIDMSMPDEITEEALQFTENPTQQNEVEVPVEFDLSSISFDLDETTDSSIQNSDTVAEEASHKPPPESEDVAIKLDLVAAYIEMDDKEGARELLEEVLKEGGLEQQKRAQTLLADLN